MAVRVVIVDDHDVFRRTATKLLELDGFRVVGEAADGASGIALVRALEPDVVLLDVGLPDISGFDVADALGDVASKIVLVSSRDPSDFAGRAGGATAGFLAKDRLSTVALRDLLEAA